MKNKLLELKNKFWFRLFLRLGIVFAVFVLVLCVCNTVFLSQYYEYSCKKELKASAKQLKNVDVQSSSETVEIINDINENYGFEVEIYNSKGKTLFSSSSGQMLDYFFQNNNKLNMNHRPLHSLKSETYSDGSVMEVAIDGQTKNEYLIYKFEIDDNIAEIRTQMAQIKSSAKTANVFISIVASAVMVLAIIWVFWFSRKVAGPISEMNESTRKMAAFDFSKKLKINSADEIGELADSINTLSATLDRTIKDLNASNAQLRDEIETEHQLDVMRKGFVANVSHELKTPISIIQGYAEGLKVDINSSAREKYCDTIIDESQRMNKLVLSLLDLSKYESGQSEINASTFDLSELAKNRADRILKGKKAYVEFDLPDKAMVTADLEQIDQVIKSYVENAAAYVEPNGKIKISLELSDEKIYTLSVFNSGSRVDEEQMAQIWQSFFRGDKSHKRDSTHFGLGLSIVSAIIKLHKRECGVYNTDDGVCFWFTVNASVPKEN